jgi:hypothetical protein
VGHVPAEEAPDEVIAFIKEVARPVLDTTTPPGVVAGRRT